MWITIGLMNCLYESYYVGYETHLPAAWFLTICKSWAQFCLHPVEYKLYSSSYSELIMSHSRYKPLDQWDPFRPIQPRSRTNSFQITVVVYALYPTSYRLEVCYWPMVLITDRFCQMMPLHKIALCCIYARYPPNQHHCVYHPLHHQMSTISSHQHHNLQNELLCACYLFFHWPALIAV